jgi:hypothetical protein
MSTVGSIVHLGREQAIWRAILTGPTAERAQVVVELIADRLRGVAADWIPDGLPDEYRGSIVNSPGLASGRAGLAVFYGYLARTWSRKRDRERSLQLLEEAIDLLAVTHTRASLYAGYAGTAWVAEHLRRLLLGAEGEDPNGAIDEALLKHLDRSPWPDDYDLVNGLVGFGVYALERLPLPAAVECLTRIVERLHEMAEHTPPGVTWLSSPTLLPAPQRALAPGGYYNLGVAHGIPGVIALLAWACAADVSAEKARPLLEGAVEWLLAQRLPEIAGSTFPLWAAPGIDVRPARLAWCYGDAGIAAALLSAARCVGNSTWEAEAVAIARRAARRRFEDSGVVDVGLCHGAAGLGHIFNRLYQATGDGELGGAARQWFTHSLTMRRPNEGIAGYLASMRPPDGEERWVADPCFLTGAAGIGLALLAAITPVEPAWDRVLLVSVPPTRSQRGADRG